ncbi:MAG: DEAD/DEAH box helicase [Chthoniobacterales bacterium]|nr:DEAD/DEAH box helicase [Chthoniobacterales bacterium]
MSRLADASDPDCRGLDRTLAWFLKGQFVYALALERSLYSELVATATDAVCRFYSAGVPEATILAPLRSVRGLAYAVGTAREVLLADLILAIATRRIQNSARVCLPEFTGIPASEWEAVLQRPTFIREFWPAQRLLGENGVFRGRSAVVQMPTSAGKTKATEILIRSAFIANRSTAAIIVAPFRALCHEIRDTMIVAFRGEDVRIDELSDIPQQDFNLAQLTTRSVIILTPEKLLYILR